MEDTTQVIAIVAIVVVAAALLLWLLMQRRRSETLRAKFGDEYDRTIDARGGRAEAEADLIKREERVKKLDIRPLGREERNRFTDEWQQTKALFVDGPAEAISRSDRLLTQVMTTRGYPMTNFEHRHQDLTVQDKDVAQHYLTGHEIADRATRGEASTEDLRQAMQHFEALFEHLVNDSGDSAEARPTSSAAQT